MADIVYERERFDQIDVQAELGGNGTGDLRDLDGVGQAVAEVIGVAAGKNLGFVFEAPEGAGVDDAVAIALKGIAVRVRRLGKTASAGLLHAYRVVGEHGMSVTAASAETEPWLLVCERGKGLCWSLDAAWELASPTVLRLLEIVDPDRAGYEAVCPPGQASSW